MVAATRRVGDFLGRGAERPGFPLKITMQHADDSYEDFDVHILCPMETVTRAWCKTHHQLIVSMLKCRLRSLSRACYQ